MTDRPRYFAIIGAMRTGSNLLERLLDDYEGLVGLGELFNPSFIGKPERTEAYGFTLERRNRDPVGFLGRVLEEHEGETPGFRIFNGHSPRMLAHIAQDPRCARLILTRDRVDSFVSLQIAEKTQQWMLRKEENRRTAKVRFDENAFREYERRIEAHYAGARDAIRAAGQGAFEVAYPELKSLDILNGAARYAGAAELKDALAPKIRRQNPVRLEDRVENPDEVRAAVAGPDRADPAAAEGAPHEHPLRRLIVSRGVELIYAPLPGACDREIVDLIRRAERRIGRDDKDIVSGLKGKQVERRRRRGTFVFSFARHPAPRLREAFRRIVGAPDEHAAALDALARDYGAPSLAAMAGDGGLFEAGFDAFIRFAKDGVEGRAAAAPDPLWAPQSTLLAGYAAETPLDFVGRAERFEADARYALERLGLGEHADLVEPSEPEDASWLTPERDRAILAAYERDYLRLGYRPLAS